VQLPLAKLLYGELEYEVAAMIQDKDTPRCDPGKFTMRYLGNDKSLCGVELTLSTTRGNQRATS